MGTAAPSGFNDYWRLYLRGLFEYLKSKHGFSGGLISNLENNWKTLGFRSEDVKEIYMYVYGGMETDLGQGVFKFARTVPHPQGLRGCSFITSFHFNTILSINLCSVQGHRSVRMLCPERCSCGGDDQGCPISCP